LEYLDLFFCHRPDKKTPISEVVWTMNLLINQGKILYWGTSE
jgi:aryl-alcohol dehydrogenase-like predicted oxidoreductase